MWELQRKCIFIEKKLQKDLVESEKSSTFALAFKNDAWLIRLRIRLEGWVSGWNQQFAKLPCGLPYRGFESPTFRKHVSRVYRWSIHLMVRIQDSQSWHRGSIPLSTTKVFSCINLDCLSLHLVLYQKATASYFFIYTYGAIWNYYTLSSPFSFCLPILPGRSSTRYSTSASEPYRL